MDFSILLRSTSLTLSVSASWHTWESSCTAAVLATGRPVLSWVCSTLRLLLSSDERVWITSVSTGRPVLSEELSEFFVKRIHTDLLRTGRFSFILHVIRSPRSVTNWIWSWLGRLENLVCRTTSPSGCRTASEHNSLVHSWRSEFGGGRGDMHTFSFKTSPVFSLTTFGMQ